MQPVQDTAALFQLLHLLGVPGIMTLILAPVLILALILFIFLRQDQTKWETMQKESADRWDKMQKENAVHISELLESHKEERDRDYGHLKELMDGFSGQYAVLTSLVSKMDVMDRGIGKLGESFVHMPEMFGDIHRRIDIMMNSERKGSHGPRNFGAQGPASAG